jgi:hypothetical protein
MAVQMLCMPPTTCLAQLLFQSENIVFITVTEQVMKIAWVGCFEWLSEKSICGLNFPKKAKDEN